MNRRLALAAGIATAGIALGAPMTAYADATSQGNAGVGNGTQVHAPVQAPVNVCGNGVGVLGAGAGTSGDCSSSAVAKPTTSCPPSDDGYGTECPSSSPSPSKSPSESPTPASPSAVATTPVATTKPTLPVTGSSLTILVVAAVALLAGGVAFLLVARRRRA